MKLLFPILFLSLIFSFSVFAQKSHPKLIKVNNNQDSKKIKIETLDQELSFLFPENFNFYRKKEGFNARKGRNSFRKVKFRNFYTIISYENGVSIWLERYDVKRGKEAFKFYPFYGYYHKNQKINDYKIGKYNLREIRRTNDNLTIYKYFFNSDKKFYVLGIGTRTIDKNKLRSLLSSFEFNKLKLFNSVKVNVALNQNTKTLILEELKETLLEVSKEKKVKSNKQGGETSINLQKDKNSGSTEMPMEILSKPRPGYTEQARQNNVQGTIKLRIQFEKTGLIRNIKVVKGLRFGLTEKTIEAAKLIKFLPPVKNGEPYSTTKMVPYKFTIY